LSFFENTEKEWAAQFPRFFQENIAIQPRLQYNKTRANILGGLSEWSIVRHSKSTRSVALKMPETLEFPWVCGILKI